MLSIGCADSLLDTCDTYIKCVCWSFFGRCILPYFPNMFHCLQSCNQLLLTTDIFCYCGFMRGVLANSLPSSFSGTSITCDHALFCVSSLTIFESNLVPSFIGFSWTLKVLDVICPTSRIISSFFDSQFN